MLRADTWFDINMHGGKCCCLTAACWRWHWDQHWHLKMVTVMVMVMATRVQRTSFPSSGVWFAIIVAISPSNGGSDARNVIWIGLVGSSQPMNHGTGHSTVDCKVDKVVRLPCIPWSNNFFSPFSQFSPFRQDDYNPQYQPHPTTPNHTNHQHRLESGAWAGCLGLMLPSLLRMGKAEACQKDEISHHRPDPADMAIRSNWALCLCLYPLLLVSPTATASMATYDTSIHPLVGTKL